MQGKTRREYTNKERNWGGVREEKFGGTVQGGRAEVRNSLEGGPRHPLRRRPRPFTCPPTPLLSPSPRSTCPVRLTKHPRKGPPPAFPWQLICPRPDKNQSSNTPLSLNAPHFIFAVLGAGKSRLYGLKLGLISIDNS